VSLYDFGVSDEGCLYYVMELLDGLDVDQLVRRNGPQPGGRVISLIRQVCDSLEEAHDMGMVHRDIKPSNLFVCRLGKQVDFVKVLDFGLVKHRPEAATVSVLTSYGKTAGTPAYIAPEIALGDSEVDGRADLYSLGCVAYYLVTGQMVFSGNTPVAQALAHVQNEPVAPSLRSTFHIPAALDALILECLAKDPATRPASAAVVSNRLAAAVPANAWTPEAAHAWWERHRPLTPSGTSAPGAGPDDRTLTAV
jgi:serine/threonine-protein kinase